MGLFRRRPARRWAEPAAATTESPWRAPASSDELPEELAELTMTTLDHALDSIEHGGPLIPLVLVESESGLQSHRFLAERLEEGLARAREFVSTDQRWRRATLAYDGYLSMGDDRRDAIYVLGWDRERRTAVSVAHRYAPAGPDRPLTRLGEPLYLGAAPPPGV